MDNQKLGVDSFAQAKNFHIDEYIQDEGVSGCKDPSKRKLGPLLEKLQNGDVLICSEISRLGGQLQKRLQRLRSNELIKEVKNGSHSPLIKRGYSFISACALHDHALQRAYHR